MTKPETLRDLLAEAAELRARRDFGAAEMLEHMALVHLRSHLSAPRTTQPKRRPVRRRARA